MSRCFYNCSIEALRHPWRFVASPTFRISWVLYAATYAVSNGSNTIAHEFGASAAATSSINFASTMTVNVPLGIWKDMRFASIFGTPAIADPLANKAGVDCVRSKANPVRAGVPNPAIGAFLFRDALTIFGSFTMAPALTAAIPDGLAPNPHTKAMITQLTMPALSQLVATPVHLLGLDLHSRPGSSGITVSDRWRRIRGDLYPTTVIRCIRIIPAFGVGCIVNSDLQSLFHSKLSA